MSAGFMIGASAAHLTGRALNVLSPYDVQGSYAAIGAGGALAAGAGSVQLQNDRGVILQLSGGRMARSYRRLSVESRSRCGSAN
jgi:hypothetical protein